MNESNENQLLKTKQKTYFLKLCNQVKHTWDPFEVSRISQMFLRSLEQDALRDNKLRENCTDVMQKSPRTGSECC